MSSILLESEKGVELFIRLEIRAYYCRAYYGSPQLFLLGSRWTNKKGLKNFWDEQNGHKQTDKRTDRWDEQKWDKQTDKRTDRWDKQKRDKQTDKWTDPLTRSC